MKNFKNDPDMLEAYEALSDPEKRRQYDRVYRARRPASLGLRVGLAVDAERPPSTGRRNGPDRSER